MKLIYISEGNLPSRAANSIQVAKMAQAFAKEVDDFELVTLGDLWSLLQGNKFDFQQWYGLTHEYKITRLPLLSKTEYPFPQKYRSQRFPRWAAFYAALKSPDLAYTRSGEIAKLALKLGLAVLWEWHMPTKGKLFQHQGFTNGKFLGVVTISEQLAQEYIEAGLPAEKVLVEHDGCDLERFLPYQSKEEARHRLSLPMDKPIVVYTGHLYDFKGIPTLYEVASMMPNCQFLLVGGWEHDVERVRQYCQSNSLSNVKVVGHVPQSEVPTYLYASDILVLPNSGKHDWSATTSPLKLFEYMAAHRPIVASALSNITTVLQDKSNAFLAEPDCPKSFRAAIERLLDEPQLGQALAEQAFQDVQHYAWERRAERILQFAKDKFRENNNSTFIFGQSIFAWGKRKLKQKVTKAGTKIVGLSLKAKNRLVEQLIGSFPRVLHNGATSGIGGPRVKLNRMQKYFPNDFFDYNIIYGIWGSVPTHVCRQAQARGVKVIYHVNSVYHPAYRSDYVRRNAVASEIYALADHVVYGSQFAKAGAERYLGQVSAPHTIIYNAVDTQHFQPSERYDPDRFHILAVGVHYIRHRLVPLILAMPHVQRVYPQAQLIIAGPLQSGEGIFDCGPESIQTVIDQVGLEKVKFLGHYTQQEAPAIYSQGDVLVHLKHMDWTPNTVIEAMACALPIVHAGNGGMNELVGNAGVSLNLPFDWDRIHTPEPLLLAERIIQAYEHRRELSEVARQSAVKLYDIQSWVEAHRQIFDSLLSR